MREFGNNEVKEETEEETIKQGFLYCNYYEQQAKKYEMQPSYN